MAVFAYYDKISYDKSDMDISIRLATAGDLPAYTVLLQETYEVAYTKDDIGLTRDLFSMEVFLTPNTQQYLLSNLMLTEHQKTWLAFDHDLLVGAITMCNGTTESELKGFYVRPEYQMKGIGTQLWDIAKKFASGKDIVLDIYLHNARTISIYQRWGFDFDRTKGSLMRHWDEWPEKGRAESVYMRRPAKMPPAK